MSEEVRTAQIARSGREGDAGPLGTLTLINDTGTAVSVAVGHWFWGLVSAGYAMPNQQVSLPTGAGNNDVYLLFQYNAHVLIAVGNVACAFTVTYHKRKVLDGNATAKVSEF